MTHRHSHVTQNGRVSQVTLQTADRQLGAQVLQNSIGNAQVTFSILVIYRVYLVWHGTGAYLTCLDLLLEVLHGDVLPEVAVHVYHDGVDTLQVVEKCSQKVIIGNLGGVLLTLQTQLLIYKSGAKFLPVIGWIGYMVCIEVSGCSTELGSHRNGFQSLQLMLQAIGKHFDFLAQTSWRGWLTMCLGQHRYVLPLFGKSFQLVYQLLNLWVIHVCQRFLDGQWNGGVIDIL